MIFCVKETSFVEGDCISGVFQKAEKNKKKAAILYERSSFLFEKQKPLYMMNRIGGDFLREKNFFYKRKTESGGTVVGKRWEKETDFCTKESIV